MIVSLLPGAFVEGEEEHSHSEESLLTVAQASAFETKVIESDYFYKQLNKRAQAIYTLLLDEYTGSQKAKYQTGTEFIDLMQLAEITNADVKAYKAGNKDIFNDFCAAKDALDLDHSEIWWLDSSYLTFRVTSDSEGYHVLIGPGRTDWYLLAGESPIYKDNAKTVATMDQEVEDAIDAIVEKAKSDLAASKSKGHSEADQIACVVRSVHDCVTHQISYRFENEAKPENVKFIRTLYGLVTHEGVCESYARVLQVCLSRLGVECVLIHGLQTKGTPEDHMWNAVNIPDADGTARWYVVDATWDDPLPADWYGRRELKDEGGVDGKENGTYLMVGQNVVGEFWKPSGYVSSGNFEFKYPTIETASFDGSTAFEDESGLVVKYSAGSGSMEDGTPAGVFKASFQGMGLEKAAEKGFYFLIKMMDYHPDGTFDIMQDWYYAAATLIMSQGSKFFYDKPDGLYVYTGTCEYVEIAVTTCEPPNYDQWPTRKDWSTSWQEPYFQGEESDLIAESGALYNSNASYEAPPYVKTQDPPGNTQGTAGVDYHFKVRWDDDLFHPTADTPVATDEFVDNTAQAAQQDVKLRYVTYQQDLHSGGTKVAQMVGELTFDKNRDGYVDQFTLHYVYDNDDVPEKDEVKKTVVDCPNNPTHDPNHKCDVTTGCRVDGVEFDFRASDMWADDVTCYTFILEGVVGSRSHKFPNNFEKTCIVPGLCPFCYRSQGIDWNTWGMPTMLDAPDNLDLSRIAVEGVDEENTKTLAELQKEMNVNNPRPMPQASTCPSPALWLGLLVPDRFSASFAGCQSFWERSYSCSAFAP